MPLKTVLHSLIVAAALMVSATDSVAMEFRMMQTPDGLAFISATGPISDTTAAEFSAFVAGQDRRAGIVTLNSKGGSVLGGVELGELLRAGSYKTFIPSIADCFSACAFAFIGGAEREVGPTGKLGVHQFRWRDDSAAGDDAAGKAQAISGVLLGYFTAMGIDSAVLTRAMMTPADDMYVFSREELVALRLVNDASDETAAACPFPEGFKPKDPMGLFPGCAAR